MLLHGHAGLPMQVYSCGNTTSVIARPVAVDVQAIGMITIKKFMSADLHLVMVSDLASKTPRRAKP